MTRPVSRLLACAVIALAFSSAIQADLDTAIVGEEDWYLLEFAASKPTCEDTAPGSRCWQTRSAPAQFEIRSGERLTWPSGSNVPQAWVTLRDLWVYAPSVDNRMSNGGFSIAADRTPSGLRVQIEDNGAAYLQTLPLNQWVQMRSPTHRSFWLRATRP